jgi:DNA-binding LacI/PurR family transcriptional regulator
VTAAAPFPELVDRLLALSPRPTGVFVAGDDVAVIAIAQ